MKRILMIAVLTFVASSVVLAQSIKLTDVNTEAEKEVIQAAHDISEAWAKNDLPTLERLVADDYTHTDISGKVQNREEWLADVRARAASGKVSQLEFEDEKVQIYGDVTVVTGRAIWRSRSIGFLKLPLCATQVLIKKNGQWQRSATQVGIADLPRYFFLTIVVAAAITFLITCMLLWLLSKLRRRWGKGEKIKETSGTVS
jgi:ketosteroid isomerase-like protein